MVAATAGAPALARRALLGLAHVVLAGQLLGGVPANLDGLATTTLAAAGFGLALGGLAATLRGRGALVAALVATATPAAALLVHEQVVLGDGLLGDEAVLAVELLEGGAHLGAGEAVHRLAQDGVGPAGAAELLALLARGLAGLHLSERHTDLLAVLQAQGELLLGGVVLDDLGRAERRLDDGVLLGRALLEVAVGLELVAQAAHEAAARAADLVGVERQVLLLGHADGDRLEAAAEARAAQLLAAVAEAAHEGRLLAHAHLAHVDAFVQLAGQVAHELAEVHALVGGEVAHDLLAAEEVLHAHGLHVEAALGDELAEGRHGGVALLGKLVGQLEVLVSGHAQHALERGAVGLAVELGRLDLVRVARGKAQLVAALGYADDVVALHGSCV